jgi:hypothetical protein
MATISLSNDLGLEPPRKQREAQSAAAAPVSDRTSPVPTAANLQPTSSSGLQTEFVFELPKGYLDADGNLHRRGIMRLARALDEIVPMRDPRVRSNPAYATIIILSRVITQLGALGEVSPVMIEGLFACDLNYLQHFYRHINDLDSGVVPAASPSPSSPAQ